MSICCHPMSSRNRIDEPKTTAPMPAHKIAPWHIGHGSAVVYSTSLEPLVSGAVTTRRLMASISPCRVEFSSDRFHPLDHNFARLAVDDHRAERQVGDVAG